MKHLKQLFYSAAVVGVLFFNSIIAYADTCYDEDTGQYYDCNDNDNYNYSEPDSSVNFNFVVPFGGYGHGWHGGHNEWHGGGSHNWHGGGGHRH